MIDVGDAVMTFLGDTTQLDRAFQQVADDAATKMAPATAQVNDLGTSFTVAGEKAIGAGAQAAASTVELKAAQAELRASLAAVSATGGSTSENLARLAVAEERLVVTSAAAKTEHAALRAELLGVGHEGGFVSETLGELSNHLLGMFAIVGVVEMLKDFISEVQHGVIELDNLSQKTGINISTLAGLEHVADANAVSFEAVSTALVRLGRAHTLALEGGKQQITAFERIGISIQELKSLSPEELFYRVAGAMADAKNHGDAAASAIALLGKGGAALIPIFNQGTEALRENVEEAAKASGVNEAAAQSAREWQAQTANLSETFRAAAIPAMQAVVPVIRLLEAGGIEAKMIFMELATAIMGVATTVIHQQIGMFNVGSELMHGNFSAAVAAGKALQETAQQDWKKMSDSMSSRFTDSVKSIQHVWTDVKPLQPAKDDFSAVQTAAKGAEKELIASAKRIEEAELASIKVTEAEQHQAFANGTITAKQWEAAQIKAADDARLAHQKYLKAVEDAYKQTGQASKAKLAADDLEIQKTKDKAAIIDASATRTEKHTKDEIAFQKLSAESWQKTQKEIKDAAFAEELLSKVDPFTPQVKRLLDLNNALKQVGVQGFLPLNQQLAATQRAEKLLNDAGIHGGQIWLQVQAAKLRAIIAVQAAESKSTAATVRELKQVESELRKFGTASTETLRESSKAWIEQGLQAAASAASVGEAAQRMAGAVLSGLASYAIPKGIEQMAMAFAAMSPLSLDTAGPGPHFASAAEWFAVAGAASAVGAVVSGAGGDSGSKTEWQGGSDNSAPTQSQPQPTGGVNVPHLAAGALVSSPTLALVGDSLSGGSAREGVIPLDDPEAMNSIASAIAGRMGGGGHTHIHIDGIISSDNLTKVIKQMDRQITKRQSRLTSGNSFRVTRRG